MKKMKSLIFCICSLLFILVVTAMSTTAAGTDTVNPMSNNGQDDAPSLDILITNRSSSNNKADDDIDNEEDDELADSSDESRKVFNKLKQTSSSKVENSSAQQQNQQISVGLMRNLIAKEIRGLKSSITDIVMEEVINYYGKKLDAADSVTKDIEELHKKVAHLTENYNLLTHNYKQLLKNHRNLVDLVRNNLMSLKRKQANTTPATSSSSIIATNHLSQQQQSTSSILATILTDLLLNNQKQPNNRSSSKQTNQNDLEALTLRNHLIHDLETKYSNLINQNLLMKGSNSSAVSLSLAAEDQHILTNSTTRPIAAAPAVEESSSNEYENRDRVTKRRRLGSSGSDTRKIVIRNDSKSKKKLPHMRHRPVTYNTFLNDSINLTFQQQQQNLNETNNKRGRKQQKLATSSNEIFEYPKDCQDLRNEGITKDGIYKIFNARQNQTFEVYCEFDDNSIGWLVLQRRHDGSVSFHQNWKAYENGFGQMANNGEFWLGLNQMHQITASNNYSLQIVMVDWRNEVYKAEYKNFKIDDEKSKYKLEVSGYMKEFSNAGDSLSSGDETGSSSSSSSSLATQPPPPPPNQTPPTYQFPANRNNVNVGQNHNYMPFSTYDSDNDLRFYDNCAQLFKSGWWFNQCFQSNLNGIYYNYKSNFQHQQLRFLRNGIHWNSIDFYKSLKSTKMRIRRRDLD